MTPGVDPDVGTGGQENSDEAVNSKSKKTEVVICSAVPPTASIDSGPTAKNAAISATKGSNKKPKTESVQPLLMENNEMFLKHKRRYCRIEGCNSIVKSQGLCQRHGAKPKTCKVPGCTKQAQGNFDKMCKAHFKAMKRKTTPIPKVENTDVPPPAEGFSVYDEILPKSLNFVNDYNDENETEDGINGNKKTTTNRGILDTRKLPLIVHLKHGFDTLKPPAWHRNEERRARGMFPIDNPAAQLEGWERELVWMEILVLTGVPGASFRHLARAWGRDKGFHMVLAQFICERHGNVERKKRIKEKNKSNNDKAKTDEEIGKNKRRKSSASAKKLVTDKADADNQTGERGGEYNNSNEDVGADVWDPSLYGDADTNEYLAADIFNFSEKEFERVVSKYNKQTGSSKSSYAGEPSDMSVSTAATNRSMATHAHVHTTDIQVQAAMTAILGAPPPPPQQLQTMHQRSVSMLSTASTGSSSNNNRVVNENHSDDIVPTPVHVEVTPAAITSPAPAHLPQIQQHPTPAQAGSPPQPGVHHNAAPNQIQSGPTSFAAAPIQDAQSYHEQLNSTLQGGSELYTGAPVTAAAGSMPPQSMHMPPISAPIQQQQQQSMQVQMDMQISHQQILPHPSHQHAHSQPIQHQSPIYEVQAPPTEAQNHPYLQQPLQGSAQLQMPVQAQEQNQTSSHPIMQQQQQPTHFNVHPSSTPLPHEAQAEAQAEAQLRAQSQAITQHMSMATTDAVAPPIQPQQPQPFPPPIAYAFPPQQQPLQGHHHQQEHTLTSMPAPVPVSAQPTQFSNTHTPIIQQQEQSQQMIHISYPPQKHDQLLPSVPHHVVNVSYEQQQQQHQQPQQIQYTQASVVSTTEALHLPPPQQVNTQQQQQQQQQQNLSFPQHGHQPAFGQIQPQAQDDASISLQPPQVGVQHNVHHSYPPQPQQPDQQQQPENLSQQNSDPLDLQHGMHVTRQD